MAQSPAWEKGELHTGCLSRISSSRDVLPLRAACISSLAAPRRAKLTLVAGGASGATSVLPNRGRSWAAGAASIFTAHGCYQIQKAGERRAVLRACDGVASWQPLLHSATQARGGRVAACGLGAVRTNAWPLGASCLLRSSV